jgi:hypothetical protein
LIQRNETYSPEEPYNNPFNPTALGRHGICLRKSRAGDAPAFDFPVEGLRPCSRVNGELYGPRNKTEFQRDLKKIGEPMRTNTNQYIQKSNLLIALAAFSLIGCAASGPTAKSPFTLVQGKRIGTLELVEDEETGWTKKTRDSVKFDNQYLHSRKRIGFKYPGESITQMNIYDGEKLLKSCDEGSYSRLTTPGHFNAGFGSLVMEQGGKSSFKSNHGSFTPASEEYQIKYNLECEVAEIKDGMTVDLLEGDQTISKYRVVKTPANK